MGLLPPFGGRVGGPVEAVQAGAIPQVEAGHLVERLAALVFDLGEVVSHQAQQRFLVRGRRVVLGQRAFFQLLFQRFGQRDRPRAALGGQPLCKAGHRGKGDEVLQLGQFTAQLLHDLLDQEVAEGDALEPRLTVADAVEHGGVGVGQRQLFFVLQNGLDVVGYALAQRDFHENQRLIARGRVEKGVAAAVFRVQAAAQRGPVADLMHRLVTDQFFQHGRRGVPVDALQHQKAAVEPRIEKMRKVGIQGRKGGRGAEPFQQVGAHLDQLVGASRAEVEAAQQVLPPGLASAEKPRQGFVVLALAVHLVGRVDLFGVSRVGIGQQREKRVLFLLGQLAIVAKGCLSGQYLRGFATWQHQLFTSVEKPLEVHFGRVGGHRAVFGAGAFTDVREQAL